MTKNTEIYMGKVILPEISKWKTNTKGVRYHVLNKTDETIELVNKWIENHSNYYSHVIDNKLIIYYKPN